MIRRLRASLPGEWLVFSVIVVDLIGFGILIPILPFLSPALGGNEVDVALIISIYSLFAGLLAPFWGALSDRIGRKSVLMICLFGGAVSYLLLAFSSELWMLYAARSLGGVMAGSLPVASALMADVSRPERRAKAMGLVGTAFGLGLILGPLIGGLLAGDENAVLVPGLFAAGLSLVSVVLAGLLLEGKLPSIPDRGDGTVHKPVTEKVKESLPGFVRRHGAGWLAFQYLLHTTAVSAAIYLSPLWLAAFLNWGPREVGMLFGLVGVSMILIQGVLIGWLTRTFGLIRVLAVGAAVFAGSLTATTFASGAFAQASLIVLAFTGATCCLPVLNTIASSLTEASERGRMMGVTALTSSAGRVSGPIVIGGVLALAGYDAAWLVTAVPVLGVLVWSQTDAKRHV